MSWHSLVTWLGALLFVGVLLHLGPEKILRALVLCDRRLLVASALVYVLGQLWRGLRWWYWLRFAHPPARPGAVVGSYLANLFLSNLTPARSGEALAPLLMRERCGSSVRAGAAVVTLDRFLDLLALVFWTLLVAIYLLERESFSPLGLEPRLLAVVALSLLIVGPLVGRRILRVRVESAESGEPTTWRGIWAGRLRRFRSELGRLATTPRLALGFLLTLGGWLFDFVSHALMINAFVPITLVDNAVCQTIAMWIALLSLIPGGLGVATVGHATVAHGLGYSWEAVAMGSALNVVVTQVLRFVLATLAGAQTLSGDGGSSLGRRSP